MTGISELGLEQGKHNTIRADRGKRDVMMSTASIHNGYRDGGGIRTWWSAVYWRMLMAALDMLDRRPFVVPFAPIQKPPGPVLLPAVNTVT